MTSDKMEHSFEPYLEMCKMTKLHAGDGKFLVDGVTMDFDAVAAHIFEKYSVEVTKQELVDVIGRETLEPIMNDPRKLKVIESFFCFDNWESLAIAYIRAATQSVTKIVYRKGCLNIFGDAAEKLIRVNEDAYRFAHKYSVSGKKLESYWQLHNVIRRACREKDVDVLSNILYVIENDNRCDDLPPRNILRALDIGAQVAAYEGHLEQLQILYAYGEKKYTAPLRNGKTLCDNSGEKKKFTFSSSVARFAARGDHRDCLHFLAQKKTKLTSVVVCAAIECNSESCLRFLLNNGAPVTQISIESAFARPRMMKILKEFECVLRNRSTERYFADPHPRSYDSLMVLGHLPGLDTCNHSTFAYLTYAVERGLVVPDEILLKIFNDPKYVVLSDWMTPHLTLGIFASAWRAGGHKPSKEVLDALNAGTDVAKDWAWLLSMTDATPPKKKATPQSARASSPERPKKKTTHKPAFFGCPDAESGQPQPARASSPVRTPPAWGWGRPVSRPSSPERSNPAPMPVTGWGRPVSRPSSPATGWGRPVSRPSTPDEMPALEPVNSAAATAKPMGW